MISRAEQRYLHWLGRTYWRGEGDIVEIGPWWGGSTTCLAQGMAQSGRDSTGRLYAFDNFVWRHFMSERAPINLRPGDSFLPQFVENLAPYADAVVAKVAQLPDDHPEGDSFATDARGAQDTTAETFEWRGGPVEILFVDGAKSWTAIRHLLRATGPSLVPGHSLIVCQDFAYWGGYWVPLARAALGETVAPVHRVAPGGTVAFCVTQPLTTPVLATLPRFPELTAGRGLEWLAGMAARTREHGWPVAGWAVEVAQVRFLMHLGHREQALATLARLCEEWPLLVPVTELDGARRWATAAVGTPVQTVRHRQIRRLARRTLAGRR